MCAALAMRLKAAFFWKIDEYFESFFPNDQESLQLNLKECYRKLLKSWVNATVFLNVVTIPKMQYHHNKNFNSLIAGISKSASKVFCSNSLHKEGNVCKKTFSPSGRLQRCTARSASRSGEHACNGGNLSCQRKGLIIQPKGKRLRAQFSFLFSLKI